MDMIPNRRQVGDNRRAISWRNYKVGEDLLDALGILDGDLNIVQLSRSGRDLIGVSHQNDETIAFGEIIHPRDRHQAKAALEHCLSSNSTLDIEIRLNETEEQQCWAHLRAVPMAERNLIFVTIYNISSYKAEIDQLGRFFSLSPDLFCVLDFEGGFMRINSAWELLLGWPLKTLIDNNFSSFVHPSDRERTAAQYANIIIGADTVLFENRYRTIDGTYKWIEWKSVALTEEKLIFANARDITARKEFESTLRDMEAAQISDRTKSTFLSAMSHELRTPLNGILGIASIAYDEAEGDSQRDLLSTIKTSAESLAKIVEDILDFTKIDAGQIELESQPFSVRALIAEIKRINSIDANEKGIPLIVEVEDDVPDILENDANRISQVLRNLVDNAIRFTSEGDVTVSVNIITDRDDKEDKSHCWLRFSVRDTGQGIAPNEEARIFDAFHQAQNFMERRIGGMGIGLAVSKQLLELMGGSIRLKTQLGEGSTFILEIPFKIPQSSVRHELPKVDGEAPCRSLHILVVEDNIVNQKVAIRFLTKQGHSVIVAENGHLAIEAFEKEIFDLILMDIQMPEMDGITATQCIRKIEREGREKTPIVAMTAHASKSDENGCYAAGMDDFIVKPFKPEKLIGVLLRVANANGYQD
ncbi:hypothetical protein A9Q99_18145 [Gammaproteobacteria bacterium 45_16_T64]|nr:hypothetical protein A9Q99_18145 [Gammaproteobacteria bacterium 45_16_T64]